MIIVTSKLLVLLAAEVNADTFTARSLANDTIRLFHKKYTEDDVPMLTQIVRGFVAAGFIEAIGKVENDAPELGQQRTRSLTLYCFTKKGKKARKDASTSLAQVISIVNDIVTDDLKPAVTRKLKLVKSA